MSNQFGAGRAPAPGGGACGELEPATFLLDAQGIITYCSPTAESMFGYAANQLQRLHVSRVLPELSNTDVMPGGRVNPRVAFLCHCGRRFRAQRCDGTNFDSELHIGIASLGNANGLRLLVRNASQDSRIAAAG